MTICRKIWMRLLLALVAIGCTANGLSAQETIDLNVEYQNSTQYEVQSQVQHTGRVLILQSGEEATIQSLPLQVAARLGFHERFVGIPGNPQVVRYFNQCKAEIQLDQGTTVSQLSENNKLIVSRLNTKASEGIQSASIVDMLEQAEMDLLITPADPLTFAALLNKQQVEIGDEWEPGRQQLAKFLAVHEVYATDVKLKLKSVDDGQAKVYIMGNVKADVNDVSTEMDVTGVLTVDLKSNLVSLVRLNIIEKREAGQIAPGFDGKTKVSINISAGHEIEPLTRTALAEVTPSRQVKRLLRWQSRESQFQLHYDPAWRIITSDQSGAIMRYLEDGDLLCQATVVELEQRPASNPLKLQEYRQYVAKMIEVDELQRVIDASQSVTSRGDEVLRVTVYGEEQELPLNWVYYNVTHSDGRQVAFVFTLEEAVASRVNPIAEKMVNGLIFPAAKQRDAKAETSSTRR